MRDTPAIENISVPQVMILDILCDTITLANIGYIAINRH